MSAGLKWTSFLVVYILKSLHLCQCLVLTLYTCVGELALSDLITVRISHLLGRFWFKIKFCIIILLICHYRQVVVVPLHEELKSAHFYLIYRDKFTKIPNFVLIS